MQGEGIELSDSSYFLTLSESIPLSYQKLTRACNDCRSFS